MNPDALLPWVGAAVLIVASALVCMLFLASAAARNRELTHALLRIHAIARAADLNPHAHAIRAMSAVVAGVVDLRLHGGSE